MLPEIKLHRPRGFLPKVSVRERTVVDYQPSWLLLALPALGLLFARRMGTSPSHAGSSSSAESGGESRQARGGGSSGGGASTGHSGAAPRRRRTVLILSAVPRRRASTRRPGDESFRP